ncbi:hypothetical protein OFR22_01270 [Brachyspira hyodysenteriae]|uniref:cGAS/DncV-like nucleotidyltransferase C-terminal helical domain-containing protein n=3 Tax=Brachyspira hyodysenteriae TaxID=159 RepID=A0A3B6V9L9_BRAHW|nr:hypothetical protein [Brachyspira hyodysenteriae]ACN82990.1 hypothetical protein BHWA1_00494 [Brachyspira hyodysenteriae WA1]ANN62420.1 hypothetical protein BHYOB78_00685 [Brachyspira hyodysenteriae ATCC 27164]KLI16338.1 hypothetical protein SU46_09320 [Brachyspira hyodysenteriae]KLI16992.1 hypothetical protein SU44_04660 [Brachyspira hyodysenteriae]KLI18733.1 hypothetical protein SU45_02190 [Brachyspira hyodysenteriae]
MNTNIDLYEYINKWVSGSTAYPYYKIEKKIDFISKLISSHKQFNNISIIPTGSKRNRTDVTYMEYLNIFLILDNNDALDTRKFKSSILELIKNNDLYSNKVNVTSSSLILEYENEKIVLIPSFKNLDNNVEGALVTDSNGKNEIFYPKLDNKNFDKKEHDCGSNFINLVKLFKHLFLTFSSEIKYINELTPTITEALIWNLPNEYFNFKDYDDAILKSIEYIYQRIASDDYMSLSEINDIKVLFSSRNNIDRKELLKALYKLKQFIHENI